MWIRLRDDIHPMDLFGIFHVATISKDKVYKVVASDEKYYRFLDDTGSYVHLHKSYFTENVAIDLCKSTESLKPTNKKEIYHITYSIQYAMGVELADISKKNVISIDGEIVSKGKTWVVETDTGTVIIPFRAIIHMYPKEG